MLRAFADWLRRLISGRRDSPPGSRHDPYARTPVPRNPRPKSRSGAVAVAEPDDDR